MAYRGDDLDLRTPQTWNPQSADYGTAGDTQNGKRGYRSGPILVDDTLLACCNTAYEVAAAHRSPDVRIEHLIYAMTRIDSAVATLEARGVRAASLRRDSATVVAGELPVTNGNGALTPRRADELADLLRLSATFSGRHNAPAGVDDVLQVLLDNRSDYPAAGLLLRNIARAPEPLPPLTRVSPDARYTPLVSPRYYPEPPRNYRSDIAGTPADAIQNSRIDALEQMLRALGQDFSNERHIVSGLVRELTRDTLAHQDDQGRRQTILLDRIGTLENVMLEGRAAEPQDHLIGKLDTIETGLELRLQEMSQSWSVLSKRLQELETAIRERSVGGAGLGLDDIRKAVDLGPIAHRLDVIEEVLLGKDADSAPDFSERFDRLESQIGRGLSNATGDPDRVEALLATFEKHAGSLGAPLVDQFGAVGERMDAHHRELSEKVAAVEAAVAAEIETAAAKHQAYAQDLTEVHDALMKLNQNQHTLAGSIDQWRTDQSGDIATITNLIGALDRDTSKPFETLNALNAHMDTMNRLIIERYHRRNRFWYWLFGTDDWIGASWPSQKAAIVAEKERVRTAQQV